MWLSWITADPPQKQGFRGLEAENWKRWEPNLTEKPALCLEDLLNYLHDLRGVSCVIPWRRFSHIEEIASHIVLLNNKLVAWVILDISNDSDQPTSVHLSKAPELTSGTFRPCHPNRNPNGNENIPNLFVRHLWCSGQRFWLKSREVSELLDSDSSGLIVLFKALETDADAWRELKRFLI